MKAKHFQQIQDKANAKMHKMEQSNEKNAKYNAVSYRNGHMFVAFVVDKFGAVIKEVLNLIFQMFKRNAKNNCNKISGTEQSPMLRQM